MDLFLDNDNIPFGKIVSIGEESFLIDLKCNSIFRVVSESGLKNGYIVIAIAKEENRLTVHEWLFGVVDMKGVVIIPCKYRSIKIISKNLFHVELDCPSDCWLGFETLAFDIDSSGAPIIHSSNGDMARPDLDGIAEWDSIGFAKCFVKGKFGIISSTGTYIIHPLYSLLDYSRGVVKASNKGTTSFFVYSPWTGMQKLTDNTVNVIPLKPFSYYKIQNQERYWGTGIPSSPFKIIIPFVYTELKEIIIDDNLYFIARKNGLYGVILDGKDVRNLTDFKYDRIQYIWTEEGGLFILDIDDKRGLFSIKEGRLLIDATRFEKEELDLNTYGEGLIGFRYTTGSPLFNNGFYNSGFYNTITGEEALRFEEGWKIRGPFKNGKATISKGCRWKVIDKNGTVVKEWVEKPSREVINEKYGWEDAFDGDPSLYWNID